MIDNIIAYSIRNKFIIGVFVLALIGWGIFSASRLPVDAVPDITNNQVLIITTSPNLATLEVEQFITTPVELAMQNVPGIVELRSISRFGLSVVTVVFKENMGTYLPRQLVSERLKMAEADIPEGLGNPELAPISTGLGEIYQYVVRAEAGYEDRYPLMELRSIQDWIIKRQLSGLPGVIEVNTLGGKLKQYEVAIDPEQLRAAGITMPEVLQALESSNENTGGAYIEKTPSTYFIRSEGMVKTLEDIGNIVVKNINGIPVLVQDIARVGFGHAPRYGATTTNAQGEVVGGIVLMLKGENSTEVTKRVQERMQQVQKSLPEGVVIEPFLVRNDLVQNAIRTVETNLIEGGLIVIFVLVLLLGNLRAGLVVASVIPLSLLFAFGMMNIFGISANLMSLGAIDFGLIVDGAVIIVEAIVHRLQLRRAGEDLSQAEMDAEVLDGAIRIRKSAAFGEIIILMVYIPILALTGIEGKMFRPMAMTVGFAILGALILSLTYVPAVAALVLKKQIRKERTIADRIMDFFQWLYAPVIRFALRAKVLVIAAVLVLFVVSIWLFTTMGGEFIPTLEEGDLALHQILPPGSSLEKSVEVSAVLQQKLLDNFPEVEKVVTKIGSAEVPTDPMSIETGDIIVVLKPKEEWTSASTKQELFEEMEEVLNTMPGVNYEFSQPIQMRFNELMTGSRGDIAVKIYGEDLDLLYNKGKTAEQIINRIEGIASVKVEQVTGMPQIIVRYNYAKLAQYGLQVQTVNRMISAAFAGEKVSTVFEGDRRYSMVVRLGTEERQDISNVNQLYIPLGNGQQVPLSAVAEVTLEEAPMQISRDDTKRRIVISVNAGKKDIKTLVNEMQVLLDQELDLPPGYYVTFGGQFENLINAQRRLSIAVPVALFLIFVLLYLTFGSFAQALLIFTAIPLSAIGGIWALWLRDMPFSISAGIGFIALFGVAVLNGIVLIAYFNDLKKEGVTNIRERILRGTRVRLRPVIMTASVASFGFLPMALSHSGGAEVQRPLATVVIGGLITATMLTLVVLPILYSWVASWKQKRAGKALSMLLLVLGSSFLFQHAQAQSRQISIGEALESAVQYYPGLTTNALQVRQQEILQGSGFNPPNTLLYYGGDGLGKNSSLAEHSFGVQQSFQLPKAYRSENELQKATLQLVMQNQALTEREVRQQVSQLYADWLALREKQEVYMDFDSLYAEFLEVARVRVETGEANPLEQLTVRNKLENLRLAQRQLNQQAAAREDQLQIFLNTDEGLQPREDSLQRWALSTPDTSLAGHPLILRYQQLQAVAQAKVAVEQSKLLPDFNIRYASQIFGGIGGLHGLQVGVGIPLFTKAQQKRIEASKLEQELVQSQSHTQALLLRNRLLYLLQILETQEEALQFYEREGQTFSRTILEAASLNYRLGELGYVEYFQALEQVFDLRVQYLNSLQQYNQAVIQINYLTIN